MIRRRHRFLSGGVPVAEPEPARSGRIRDTGADTSTWQTQTVTLLDTIATAAAASGSGSPDADALYDAFVEWSADQGFALYPAQDEAVIEIVSGSHVILSTPTGTGKSLVAVAAHAACVARGGRTYYTAPIKALVSEKFFALVDIFGAANVGMVTGDSSVNPDAPIVCCTAEILANIALRQGAGAGVDQVVMDEFHYYGDPERGWAWQVPLLLLPRAQFVLMSATLGDVTAIAEDLERRTGRTRLADHRRGPSGAAALLLRPHARCTRRSRSCC